MLAASDVNSRIARHQRRFEEREQLFADDRIADAGVPQYHGSQHSVCRKLGSDHLVLREVPIAHVWWKRAALHARDSVIGSRDRRVAGKDPDRPTEPQLCQSGLHAAVVSRREGVQSKLAATAREMDASYLLAFDSALLRTKYFRARFTAALLTDDDEWRWLRKYRSLVSELPDEKRPSFERRTRIFAGIANRNRTTVEAGLADFLDLHRRGFDGGPTEPAGPGEPPGDRADAVGA
jgi:hypothetical protein